MLRPIKSPDLAGRLIGYHGTTAAAAAHTINVGSMEGVFTNAIADEQLDFIPQTIFSKAPIAVCTPGANVGDGGTAFLTAAPTVSAISTTTIDGAASGDVGDVHALVLGWDSARVEPLGGRYGFKSEVRATIKRPRIIGGQVSSAGAVAIGGTTFTVTDNGTGDHTINFSRPFGRQPVCVATPKNTNAGYSARISTIGVDSVRILTFDAANAAVDTDFNFIVFGADTGLEHAMPRRGPVVDVGQRLPRLLAFKVHYTTGTPALEIGGSSGSVADTGTGLATITYAEAFAREPIVVASAFAGTAKWTSLGASSASAVRLDTAGATGTLGDPTDICVFVLGFDDPTEY